MKKLLEKLMNFFRCCCCCGCWNAAKCCGGNCEKCKGGCK